MIVSECMKRKVVTVSHRATIGEAADVFVANHIGTLPVLDDGGILVGILHLRDLLDLIMPAFVDLLDDFDFVRDFGALEDQLPSGDAMLRPVTTVMEPPTSVRASSGLVRVFALLKSHELLDLPIVDDDGHLVGLASRVDVGRSLLSSWHRSSEPGASK